MCWHRKVDRKSVGEGKRVDISVTGVQTCALPISVMVHRYPAAVKAFYMATDAARPDLALCVDVLAPEGRSEERRGGEEGRYQCDWSSDVCSSDLGDGASLPGGGESLLYGDRRSASRSGAVR